MIDTQEPKDGDFIAYIEQLQKESAARLLGSNHHLVNQLDKTGAAKADSHFFAGRKPADLRSAAQLQATLAQVVALPSIGHLFASALPTLIGALFALYWLVASAGIASLAIGIALIFWGVRLFQRALRRFSPQESKHAQALVSKVFTAPTPPAKAK